MTLRRAPAVVSCLGLLVGGLSCGGSSSSPGTPSASPTPVAPAPSPTASAPLPSPTPGAQSCAYGFGTLDTFCDRAAARHLEEVNGAIDRVVQQHPEYFNPSDVNGEGGFRVLRPSEYHAEVVANLRQSGFCAQTDEDTVALKNTTDYSETYDVILGSGHIRRGGYVSTCTPPSFPIDAREAIAYVRVAFFGIICPDGVTPPRNGENILPLNCRGLVTATPKRTNNEDVPHEIVAGDISWRLEQAGDVAVVHDDDHNAFNKTVVGRNPGRYTLCATSHGVEGCQHAEIVPEVRP